MVKYHLRRGVGLIKFLENGTRPQPPTSPCSFVLITWLPLTYMWHGWSIRVMTHICQGRWCHYHVGVSHVRDSLSSRIHMWHDWFVCDMTYMCQGRWCHYHIAVSHSSLIYMWHDSFIRDMTHICQGRWCHYHVGDSHVRDSLSSRIHMWHDWCVCDMTHMCQGRWCHHHVGVSHSSLMGWLRLVVDSLKL